MHACVRACVCVCVRVGAHGRAMSVCLCVWTCLKYEFLIILIGLISAAQCLFSII